MRVSAVNLLDIVRKDYTTFEIKLQEGLNCHYKIKRLIFGLFRFFEKKKTPKSR